MTAGSKEEVGVKCRRVVVTALRAEEASKAQPRGVHKLAQTNTLQTTAFSTPTATRQPRSHLLRNVLCRFWSAAVAEADVCHNARCCLQLYDGYARCANDDHLLYGDLAVPVGDLVVWGCVGVCVGEAWWQQVACTTSMSDYCCSKRQRLLPLDVNQHAAENSVF